MEKDISYDPSGQYCDGFRCRRRTEFCDAVDAETRFICTQNKGHQGPHIACCGSGHNLHRWDTESTNKKPGYKVK